MEYVQGNEVFRAMVVNGEWHVDCGTVGLQMQLVAVLAFVEINFRRDTGLVSFPQQWGSRVVDESLLRGWLSMAMRTKVNVAIPE